MENTLEYSILLIEDDLTDADFLRNLLESDPLNQHQVTHVTTIGAARKKLELETFDIILTDLNLPDSNFRDTIASIPILCEEAPVIALTGLDDQQLGLDIIRAGAADYLPKLQIAKSNLERAINYAIARDKFVGIQAINLELQAKNERLAELYSRSQQFVDNVSHEFRTPLTVIREFASIIRDELDGPVTEKQRSRLNGLINRADDLSSMVDDLLDTSRLESGLISICRRQHRLKPIIQQVCQMLSSRAVSKQIELNHHEIPEQLEVFCDSEKLSRILINLAVNALKFTQVGGKISLELRTDNRHQVEIVVVDNGPGIPRDDLNRIFERFEKVSHQNRIASCKGFGLGLSIARSLAYLNLGQLKVASQLDVGSKFSVFVPKGNLESILECYVEQRRDETDWSGQLSLSKIQAPESLSGDDADIIDEFLQNEFRCHDLIWRQSNHEWMLLSKTGMKDFETMKARILGQWRELQNQSIGQRLPDLDFKPLGEYDPNSEFSTLHGKILSIPELPPSRQLLGKGLPASNQQTILVIEDEVELANALEVRLSANGFNVLQANNGVIGVDRAINESPDLIILDIRLPKLDGIGVLRALTQLTETASIPVIVVSGSLSDKRFALDHGADCFLHKPYKPKQLMTAVDFLLSQKSPPNAPNILQHMTPNYSDTTSN